MSQCKNTLSNNRYKTKKPDTKTGRVGHARFVSFTLKKENDSSILIIKLENDHHTVSYL